MYVLMFPANVFPLFRKNVWEEYNVDTILPRGRIYRQAQACTALQNLAGYVTEVSKHPCSLIAESPNDAPPILKSPESLSSGSARPRYSHDFIRELLLCFSIFLGVDFTFRVGCGEIYS